MTGHDETTTRLRAERRGAVLLLTLDGPRSRNAVGPDIYPQVQAHLISAATDPGLRAVILTGAGGFFSSGGHVRALQDSAQGTLAAATTNTDKLNAMIKAIVDCPLPVIAAVEGGAAGAALGMVLACDLIVAARDAKFTVAHVRVGLSPDGGVTHFLAAAMPRQAVMAMCLLGEPVGAADLAQAGIVTTLAAPGTALDTALALAHRLADGPPCAIGRIKHLVTTGRQAALATHLDAEAQALNRARFGREAAEGLAAFREKRRPDFNAGCDPAPTPVAGRALC
ncbi:oxepin-CoA hydrolase, alternative type [Aquabacter spiritensis]|uniref:Enoyl-CoA hydratase/carnithine racemase n=1 Tax=Aquabacter spiritensis TaxID=933073 RepID=A0A4R3LR00_9HYPH|nr:enoyl-CoA hydratase family protein [Aquabacter spiritensis]TCT00517.1 enoyl-CoA hydratase/carnithine racemase [Aquabacter spiritensis]